MLWFQISLIAVVKLILVYMHFFILSCFSYCRFPLENNQQITVQEYFIRMKGVKLQYLYLPCLSVGAANREKPIYLPPEVRKFFLLINDSCTVNHLQIIYEKWIFAVGTFLSVEVRCIKIFFCIYDTWFIIRLSVKENSSNCYHLLMWPPVVAFSIQGFSSSEMWHHVVAGVVLDVLKDRVAFIFGAIRDFWQLALDDGTTILGNVTNYLPSEIASLHRNLEFSATPLWEPLTSSCLFLCWIQPLLFLFFVFFPCLWQCCFLSIFGFPHSSQNTWRFRDSPEDGVFLNVCKE